MSLFACNSDNKQIKNQALPTTSKTASLAKPVVQKKTSADVPDGTFKKISNSEANRLFEEFSGTDDLKVLDVRTPGEFYAGALPLAQNLDYHGSDFEQQLKSLDKSKVYLVYCQTGYRSQRVFYYMRELGFKKVYELSRGYAGWY
jgi:rhodanese-related sulfurtransferase